MRLRIVYGDSGSEARMTLKKGDPGMGSGVTSARSVHQLFLAGEFVFKFLVAAVLHFADVLEVVDFCVLLGDLILEVFALGGVGLFGFDAAVQLLAEAIHGIAELFDGIVSILDDRIVASFVFIARTALKKFLRNGNCRSGTENGTD